MIWGLGTGRCGTHSLAKVLDGVHEPTPKYMKEGADYHRTGEGEQAVINILLNRMKRYKNDKAIVDLHNVPILDLIERVDPKAKYVLVWREFNKVWRSQQLPGHQYWEPGYRDWDQFISPPDGWSPKDERHKKAFGFWHACNLICLDFFDTIDRDRWWICHAEEIPVTLAASTEASLSKAYDAPFDLQERATVMETRLRSLGYEQTRDGIRLPFLP